MKKFGSMMKRLYRDERGAEGLEKLLILAAIIIPLLGILWWAKDFVAGFAEEESEKLKSDQNRGNNNSFFGGN